MTVVVPAYNEEHSLAEFLPELIRHCTEKGHELVVVNDGSNDGTAQILAHHARSGELIAVHHKLNRGYGGAIKSGIRAATGQWVITVDADGQHDPADIDRLLDEAIRTDADMVVGDRTHHTDASLYRSIGKRLIRWFARVLMPVPIKDINSGMKLYRTDLARRYMGLCPDQMAYSDTIGLVFIWQRQRVVEFPINLRPRSTGRSTISTMTALDTVKEILNIVILFNPLRVFVPAALMFMAVSVAWGVAIYLVNHRGLSIAAMLGFTTGLLFLFLGLLAEQLSYLRKKGIDE